MVLFPDPGSTPGISTNILFVFLLHLEKSFKFAVYLAIATGVLYHLLLCLRPDPLLTDRPFRDDSFYVFTIADNIASGKGMTTANGEIPANGFHPIIVFLSSIPFLFSADKFLALRVIHIIHLIIHLTSGYVLYKLTGVFNANKAAKLTAAAIWMSSYYILDKMANGLESSLYLLMILLTSFVYLKRIQFGRKLSDNLLFGLFLAITTLTRIDAVFLCLAFGIHYVYLNLRSSRFQHAALVPFLWFTVWLIVTLPWWLYNINLAGSVFPTSGQVQTIQYLTGSYFQFDVIAKNLIYSFNIFLDQIYIFFVTPIRVLETREYFAVLWIIVRILFLGLVVYLFKKKFRILDNLNYRNIGIKTIFFLPLFIFFLFIFYNFYFGAPWYLNRYLAPAAIIFILAVSLIINRYNKVLVKIFIYTTMTSSVLIGSITLYKYYDVMYNEQVNWVKKNASESDWVAAMQSGTLGYFHDKTINADGKVNSEIIKINIANLGDYLYGRNIEYLIEEKVYLKPFLNDNLLNRYRYFDETEHFTVMIRRKP